MRRLPLVVAALVAVIALGLLSGIVTQGFQDMARAEAERGELEQRTRELEQRISELEATLQALRSNPEAVEALARRDLGWIRPGERVVILATPTPAAPSVSLTEPTPTPILSLRD